METSASRIQVLILFIVFVKVLADETTTSATTSNVTHKFEPFEISTQRNGSKDNESDLVDTSADESVKVENRHSYDSGYEPHTIKERDNSSSSTVKFYPRKSVVIHSIPRKAVGIGTLTNKSPSGGVKDFGSGEPTTTIVYATSIPTSMPSRTFVNIRPVLHSSNQQRIDSNIENRNHRLDAPSVEHGPYKEKIQSNAKEDDSNFGANGDGNENQHRMLKPIRRIEPLTSSIPRPRANEAITIAVSSGMQPSTYQTEQTRRNVYKSFPYLKIRTNEDTNGEVFSSNNNQHRLYRNHPEMGYPKTLEPNDSEQPSDIRRNNYSPLRPYSYHQPQTFAQQSQYLATTEEHPNHHVSGSLTAAMDQNQCAIQQGQQYQPLTVRDFDLLLQLLVLREQRLNPARDQYHSNIPQETGNNYYFNMPKSFGFMPDPMENPLPMYRRREPVKEMPRIQAASRQLPPNIREELLFRMLLLALHLQPQPQPQPQPHSMSNPQSQHFYQLYPRNHNLRSFFPRDSEVASYINPDISSQTGAMAPVFMGIQYSPHRNAILKNPIRSVQVLGEID